MMLGVDPRQLRQIQQVTSNIRARIEVAPGRLELLMIPLDGADVDPNVIQQLIDSLASSLAQQLSSFFAIKGELVRSDLD